MTDQKTPKRVSSGGRPVRKDAIRRAVEAASVDPSLIDPRAILAGIAIDKTAPATARVAAARVLLLVGTSRPSEMGAIDDADAAGTTLVAMPEDALTARALALMNMKGSPN